MFANIHSIMFCVRVAGNLGVVVGYIDECRWLPGYDFEENEINWLTEKSKNRTEDD